MNEAQTDSADVSGSRNALLQKAIDEPDLTWRVLDHPEHLPAADCDGAAGACSSHVTLTRGFFGDAKPTLFAATAAGYLVFARFLALSLRQRWVAIGALGRSQLFVDVVAVVTLMHASGGISSGLGGLLVVFSSALAASSCPDPVSSSWPHSPLSQRWGNRLYTQLSGFETGVNYPAAGILCAILFAMALAAQPLARRIRSQRSACAQVRRRPQEHVGTQRVHRAASAREYCCR